MTNENNERNEEMNEEVKVSKFGKLKQNLKKNKKKIIVGGAVAVGGAVLFYAGYRYGCSLNKDTIKNTKEMVVKNVVAKDVTIEQIDNSVNTTNNVVNFGGYTTKLVECVEDGTIYRSAGKAARAAGVSKDKMSKCINGHTDSINGKHYRTIGLGTVQKGEGVEGA